MYRFCTRFYVAAPMLTVTAAMMLVDLLVCIVALLFDHTVITGAPAWLKPIKFAISTGIYALSLVVVIRYTTIWKRTLRVAELLTGVALLIEIGLIDLQAARHTTSHFNVATSFDAKVFAVMGAGIGVLWLCSILLTVATFRTRYGTTFWAIAVRYGMLLAVLGAGTGALMTTPSHAQLEAARATHHMEIVGSHTMGGPDGGAGLPVLGWSTQHGDVRVAHFLGLHGLQVLALLVLFLQRRRVSERKALRITSAVVLSYGGLFLITLVEALLKKPVTSNGQVFSTMWIVWGTLSLGGLLAAGRTSNDRVQAAPTCGTQVIA